MEIPPINLCHKRGNRIHSWWKYRKGPRYVIQSALDWKTTQGTCLQKPTNLHVMSNLPSESK